MAYQVAFDPSSAYDFKLQLEARNPGFLFTEFLQAKWHTAYEFSECIAAGSRRTPDFPMERSPAFDQAMRKAILQNQKEEDRLEILKRLRALYIDITWHLMPRNFYPRSQGYLDPGEFCQEISQAEKRSRTLAERADSHPLAAQPVNPATKVTSLLDRLDSQDDQIKILEINLLNALQVPDEARQPSVQDAEFDLTIQNCEMAGVWTLGHNEDTPTGHPIFNLDGTAIATVQNNKTPAQQGPQALKRRRRAPM